LGLDATVKFEVGNIYALESFIADKRFDCIVLRGVLHHLPDPARAIAGLAAFGGTIIVLEPNGNNPVLKLLEKYSRYHIEHEERSFTPALIRSWLVAAGFRVCSSYSNGMDAHFLIRHQSAKVVVALPTTKHRKGLPK
jgi:2-polyprenyl-3-methyl-5-hydroxy-6-metoxy-1,4-benzoquinol methylase